MEVRGGRTWLGFEMLPMQLTGLVAIVERPALKQPPAPERVGSMRVPTSSHLQDIEPPLPLA
jgi:hypothetical protein